MTIGEIIKNYCKSHGISQAVFAERCGRSPSYISMLVKEKNPTTGQPVKPMMDTYKLLAKTMGITLDELLLLTGNIQVLTGKKSDIEIFDSGALQHQKIPLIGSVAGGEPIYDEEFDVYLDGPTKASCAVRLRGDSMEPTYINGDIIYIKLQPDVRDGEIAVVFLDDESVLKRVYHIQNGLQLLSDNRKYSPITATLEDYNNIRILGIPCGYTRLFDNDRIEFI